MKHRSLSIEFAARLFDKRLAPVTLEELSPGLRDIFRKSAKTVTRNVTVVTKPKSGRAVTRIVTVGRR